MEDIGLADCQDLTNILITCYVWLTNLASCRHGRKEIFKHQVIRLVAATFEMISWINKHDPGLELAALESVGEFLFDLLFKFSKYKERKTELETSGIFNLTVDNYLRSSKPSLYY